MSALSVLRTIKNGKVRLGGKIYTPDSQPYHGQLDGTRWYFKKYSTSDTLAMWGDEKRYRASLAGEDTYNKDCDERIPKLILLIYLLVYLECKMKKLILFILPLSLLLLVMKRSIVWILL